jgi:hypothetical protein
MLDGMSKAYSVAVISSERRLTAGWDGRGDGVGDGSGGRLTVGLGSEGASAGELEAGAADATRAGDVADAVGAGNAVEVADGLGAVPAAAFDATGDLIGVAEHAPIRIAARTTAIRGIDPARRALVGTVYRRLT